MTDILVVNAQRIKAVPGRKTDVREAECIADLLRHGLLRGSFIQNREQRELKELVGYRKSLVEERARCHRLFYVEASPALPGKGISLGTTDCAAGSK